MILGLGNDLTDIRRIESSIERFGDRFLKRVFTDEECTRSDRNKNRAASYAKRFAAKEACAKALGSGFSEGVYWKDLGVENHVSGKPVMILTGGALDLLNSLVPEGYRPQVDLTISDEYPLAQAVVIISAIPEKP
ncbi:MAG: holo-ACP synthase [Hyphomicrobiales bacterium]|nr:MAG: holo-ACP synthase [Hyphomicrobiales bacterium]